MNTNPLKPVVFYTLALVLLAALSLLIGNTAHGAPPAGSLRDLGVPAKTPFVATRVELQPRNEVEIDTREVARVYLYVKGAMEEWNKGPVAGAITRMDDIARDIAWVANTEARIYAARSVGAREALLLASLAFWESRYRDYVDDGSCNRWAQQCMKYGTSGPVCDLAKLPLAAASSMKLGTCDGGLAASIWQIHAGDGLAKNVTTPQLAGDRRLAARTALAIARQSIQAGAGLQNYVGGVGPDRSQKAKERLDLANSYWQKHPFNVR